jgi:hypothetical protein
MKHFLLSIVLISLTISFSSAVAGNGPKGGPSFPHYQWAEISETDFEDPNRWEPRAGLQAVELHNHIFVIAGRTPLEDPFNPFASFIHGDVWVSSDLGKTWVELIEDAESAGLWRNRAYFEAVTKGNYMYIMGGQNFSTFQICPPDCPPVIPSQFFNDVWRSADGVNWQQMSGDGGAPWAARAGLSAVNFKGKLWVLGGSQGDDFSIGGGENNRILFNDVWYSNDGSEWHLATDNAPWEARAGGATVVKNGWIYLLGGEKGFVAESDYFNDVWRSRDGVNWEEVTGPNGAEWSPRPGHKCSVLANHIVCLGGFGVPFFPSDIWVSQDGSEWTQVSDSPWNNNPDPLCNFNPPPLICDNIRYDFDMLTVKGAKAGMKPSIFTFGGDREVFFPIPNNHLRVENDVWRYYPGD